MPRTDRYIFFFLLVHDMISPQASWSKSGMRMTFNKSDKTSFYGLIKHAYPAYGCGWGSDEDCTNGVCCVENTGETGFKVKLFNYVN